MDRLRLFFVKFWESDKEEYTIVSHGFSKVNWKIYVLSLLSVGVLIHFLVEAKKILKNK